MSRLTFTIRASDPTPPNPGQVSFYAKGSFLYYEDSAGTVTQINTGNSGTIVGAQNLGAGEGLFDAISGGDTLDFKSLVAGTNITLTPSATEILIDSSGVDAEGAVQAVGDVTYEATGFKNDPTGRPTGSSSMSFDGVTRLFTFTPSPSIDFWYRGTKYTKSTPQTVTISDVDGDHFIYFDNTGTLVESTTPWNLLTSVPVSYIYYNTTLNEGIVYEERHGNTMDGATHSYLHATRGTQFISGLAISGYTLNTDSDAANTFAIASGVIADEDLNSDITALADSGPYTILERAGASGVWSGSTGNTVPFLLSGADFAINEFSGGSWTKTALTGNNYANIYVFAIPSISPTFQVVIVPGQASYSTLALAQAETFASLSAGTLPFQENVLVYQLTYQRGAGNVSTGKVQLRAVTQIRTISSSSTPAAVNVHNNLTGLQGGASGLYYHSDQPINTTDNVLFGSTTQNYLQFNIAATPITNAEGLLQWNATDGTLDLGQSGGVVTLQIGQEMNKKVRNTTGVTITEAQVVYESGQLGNRPLISLARSDAEATSRITGVVTQDITNNSDGFVTTTGLVRQIKTDYTGAGDWGTTWNQGDLLYVSKTVAGQLTNVEPTVPHHSDVVGKVSVVGGVGIGSIDVQIYRHKTLEGLSDVNGTPLATTGQIPVWNNAAGYFDFNINITDYLKTVVASGVGNSLIKSSVAPTATLKGITAGTLMSITPSADDLTISTTAELNTCSNVGAGGQWYKQKTGSNFEFRTILPSGRITGSQGSNEITMGTTAELNTASNLGAGIGIYAAKVSEDLQFKSLKVAGALSISATSTEITITAATTNFNNYFQNHNIGSFDGSINVNGSFGVFFLAPFSKTIDTINFYIRDASASNYTIKVSIWETSTPYSNTPTFTKLKTSGDITTTTDGIKQYTSISQAIVQGYGYYIILSTGASGGAAIPVVNGSNSGFNKVLGGITSTDRAVSLPATSFSLNITSNNTSGWTSAATSTASQPWIQVLCS